jgi:hypothetical protein
MPLILSLLLASASPPAPPANATQWGVWELSLIGPSDADVGNPFADVTFGAEFTLASSGSSNQSLTAAGFYDGEGTYVVRFSPPLPGTWRYRTSASANAAASLAGRAGSIDVAAALPPNRGPVRSRGCGLAHADGTPHFSTGTTCYQWASMPLATQRQTLETLLAGGSSSSAGSSGSSGSAAAATAAAATTAAVAGEPRVFSKIRMTVFPKWYEYNRQNPVEVGAPFEVLAGSAAANASSWGCVGAGCPRLAGSFDLRRFNVSFWRNYESLVRRLGEQGVVADVIVFHPYDNGHWGFDCLGCPGTTPCDGARYDTANDDFYLRYLGARLSAFANVWWAMANEWNFVACKSYNATAANGPSTPVWDHLFRTLGAADPYGRQTSIHNGNLLYNHSRPWITHVSLQGHLDDTAGLRLQYGKPVVWDEVKCESFLLAAGGGVCARAPPPSIPPSLPASRVLTPPTHTHTYTHTHTHTHHQTRATSPTAGGRCRASRSRTASGWGPPRACTSATPTRRSTGGSARTTTRSRCGGPRAASYAASRRRASAGSGGSTWQAIRRRGGRRSSTAGRACRRCSRTALPRSPTC